MILYLHNKTTCAITKAIAEAKRIGGIPSYIALSPKEAYSLIRELNLCQKEKKIRELVKIQVKEGTPDPRLLIYSSRRTSKEEIEDIVRCMKDKTYLFSVDKVDLIVDEVKSQKPEK